MKFYVGKALSSGLFHLYMNGWAVQQVPDSYVKFKRKFVERRTGIWKVVQKEDGQRKWVPATKHEIDLYWRAKSRLDTWAMRASARFLRGHLSHFRWIEKDLTARLAQNKKRIEKTAQELRALATNI